jgi:nucleoside-diphosphate-sugar epimerase
MSGRRLLLLGGSGFISGELARRAVAQGHEVWTVTRGHRPLPDGAHALVADINERASLEEAIQSVGEDWDMVVDCIGREQRHGRQDVELFQNRTSHLVFISTSCVYDPDKHVFPRPSDGDLYYEDDGQPLDREKMSYWRWYALSKRRAERAIIDAERGQMDWTIVRPTHVYGPGSKLGCLPFAFRDSDLVGKIQSGKTLQLVGNGHFLQQPIFVTDLAEMILSFVGNEKTHGQIYNGAGPDIVESRTYYELIGEALGTSVQIQEESVSDYLNEHPAEANYVCHRFYDTSNVKQSDVKEPSTAITEGLSRHVRSLLEG